MTPFFLPHITLVNSSKKYFTPFNALKIALKIDLRWFDFQGLTEKSNTSTEQEQWSTQRCCKKGEHAAHVPRT